MPYFASHPARQVFSRAWLPLSITLAAFGPAHVTAQSSALPPTAEAPVALAPITVTADRRDAATTESSGSYTTRAMNTATRMNLSVRETPQSVSVVSRQIIDDFGLESITDVVNLVNGVSAKSLDSSRSGFSARGFDITNLQIDGVATTWSPGWTAGETVMDTAIYDRIEVVRGASGLIAGAGNPAAAINLVRKRADSQTLTGHTRFSAGSWDRYEGTADVSSALNDAGTVRGRVVGSYRDEGSFVDFAGNRKQVLYGTLAIDLTPNTLWNLGASYQDNDPQASTWGGLPAWYSDGTRTDWSRSKTTAADWTRWSSVNTTYFTNLEHTF
ncbi:MAG: TonB-dependent receptor plug domain-containing protein, partial [Gammaproteobacteria bacterium]|nr:TonB-dependent receptor plug domain-containing protein [Gammaproteobacteria bacterium]